MKYNTKTVLLIVISFIGSINIEAQDNNPNPLTLISEVNPLNDYRSPEASAFQRQGSFQVGEYTGTANIGIPLYSVKYKDIEIPITLSYNSNGIKVAQEASWVGLGWDISVGGCVNLIPAAGTYSQIARKGSYKDIEYVCGLVDSIHNIVEPEDKEEFSFSIYDCAFKMGNGIDSYAVANASSDILDGYGETDLYQVTMPSGSLLFYLDPSTGIPCQIGSIENLYSISYSEVAGEKNWIIKDSNGFTYYFDCYEKGTLHSLTPTISWLLTKIVSMNGNQLKFNYTQSKVNYISKLRESCSNDLMSSNGSRATNYNSSVNEIQDITYKQYLSSIESDDQIITFDLGSRLDIKGEAKRLNKITSKSKISNDVIRTIDFSYDYFSSNNVGGSYISINGDANYITKRLKLKSIVINNTEKYEFEYLEKNGFPKKSSFAIDYWGFYNGKENLTNLSSGRNGHSLIPAGKYCIHQSYTSGLTGSPTIPDYEQMINKFPGADRLSDSRYITELSLKKILYPTKGYTTFCFEPNDFLSDKALDATINDSFSHQSSTHILIGNTTDPISLPSDCTCRIVVTISNQNTNYSAMNLVREKTGFIFRNSAGEIISQYILSSTPQNSRNIFSVKKTYSISNLPIGDYQIELYCPCDESLSYGPEVSVGIECSPIKNAKTVYRSIGGGIRICSIEDYDSNNQLLEKTEYEYVNENGSSSGILIAPEKMGQIKHCTEWVNGTAIEKIIFNRFTSASEGIPAFVSAINSCTVGYSRVLKKKTTSKGENITISNYYNKQLEYDESRNFNRCLKCIPQNGQLLSSRIFDESGTLINECTYQYGMKKTIIANQAIFDGSCTNKVTVNEQILLALLKTGSNSETNINYFGGQSENLGIRSMFFGVYSLTRFWNQLLKKTETFYNDNLPSYSNTTRYEYNEKNHLVSLLEEGTSLVNEKKRTRTWYAVDSLDKSCEEMVNQHNLNSISQICVSLSINDKVEKDVQKMRTYYSKSNGIYLPNSVYTALGNMNLEPRITYQYDSNNNVAYMSKDSVTNVVYLWSYRGLYPIAKIEGKTYDEVIAILGKEYVKVLSNQLYPKDDDYQLIRKLNSKETMVTTYKYKPLIGISSETAPNGSTTSFEYDNQGRLVRTLDTNGKVVSTNSYNYIK